MAIEETNLKKLIAGDCFDLLVRLGLVVVLVVLCDRILGPFWHLLLWALIIAVGLYPLHQQIACRMQGKEGRSATLLVLGLLIILGFPVTALTTSFGDGIFNAKDQIENQTLTIPAPDPGVKTWPVIGEKVYATWQLAASDTPAFVTSLQPHLGQVARKLLAAARSAVLAAFLFLGSLVIAGIMMGYGQAGHAAMGRIFTRLVGSNGPELLALCVATIRSVAVGVLGVALIQSILLGAGFVFSGVPMAGLLAVVTLLLAVLQIPTALVVLPVLVWLWMGSSDNSVAVNVALTIYFLLAGLSDNVLRPLLMGRGVNVPMPVVLIGALGGMFSAGFIGLFVGAVGLAVGYQIFMAWVDRGLEEQPAKSGPQANS